MTFDDLQSLFDARTSTYSYSGKAVDRATVESLIEAAVTAPSVENTQPWHFHIVTDPKLKQELMETACYGTFVSDAAAFIIVTCDRAAKGNAQGPIWNIKEMEYSCASAMYGFMLAATTKGLATCWVSLHHGPAHNVLKLKDHQVVVGGMMLGYAAKDAAQKKHERKPLQGCITWHE